MAQSHMRGWEDALPLRLEHVSMAASLRLFHTGLSGRCAAVDGLPELFPFPSHPQARRRWLPPRAKGVHRQRPSLSEGAAIFRSVIIISIVVALITV